MFAVVLLPLFSLPSSSNFFEQDSFLFFLWNPSLFFSLLHSLFVFFFLQRLQTSFLHLLQFLFVLLFILIFFKPENKGRSRRSVNCAKRSRRKKEKPLSSCLKRKRRHLPEAEYDQILDNDNNNIERNNKKRLCLNETNFSSFAGQSVQSTCIQLQLLLFGITSLSLK